MIIKKIIFILIALTTFVNVLAATDSVSPARFNISDKKLDLQPYIEVLPDPERNLSIENIIEDKERYTFKTITETGNSFGFTQSAFWLRFTLNIDQMLDDSILLQLEYPLIDNVTLYIPDGDGGFDEKVTGDSLLFSTRDVSYRSFVFRLPELGTEDRTYYMRLQTEGSTQIVLSLWTATAFLEQVDTDNFVLGIYYGIMLLLMIAALAAFIKIRDRLFLYYALYLLTYIIFQLSLNGFSYQHFWPDAPWFTSRATAAFVGLVVITAIIFSGSFLQIWKEKHPRIKLLFYFVIAFAATSVILSMFGDYAIAVQLASAAGLILPPVAVIGAIASVLSGYRPARFFLIAWGIFATAIFITGLLYVGLLPNNFFTFYSIQIGSTLEVMLLGYALMDRIELLNIEKENALEKASSYMEQLNDGLESQVDVRTKQLSESEAKLRTLLETLPDLVWLKDPEGVYLVCNPKVERFFGATQDKIVGKTDYDFVSREMADFFRKTDKDTIVAGKPCRYEERITYADDGHKELLETVKTPIYSSTGELDGVLGVGRDITERQRAEHALLYTAKMDAIDQLTGGIAHDFNNILAIIIGNLNMLERQLATDEDASKRLTTIKKSAQRATDLTNQLLGFTRKKSERQVVIDINQLIDEMDSLVTYSVTPAIEVTHEFEQKPWLTRIDPGDFQDALINLVINARDAMSGSGKLVLNTSNCLLDDDFCRQHPDMVAGEYVKLSVIDNGRGISESQLERIFEPFYTTKKMGKGTGLGLSMVFGFIKRANGYILVESEPGIGTAVYLYLPRIYDKPVISEVLDEKTELLHRGQETILVVDDEEALLELATDVLEELDYRVLTAKNGKQALAILADEPEIDLLLSDVLMPGGINGYELAESATASHPGLKVLLASGYNSNVNIHDNQVHLSANMLKKPYDLSTMTRRVREILDA